ETKHAIPRASTYTAAPAITKAVIDSAIKTNVGAPIARAPYVDPVAPAPITRRPQQAHGRRQHPGARNPVISNRTDPPVARGPYVTGCRNRGLLLDRQFRWRTCIAGTNDLRVRGDRHGQPRQRQRKQNNGRSAPHTHPLAIVDCYREA